MLSDSNNDTGINISREKQIVDINLVEDMNLLPPSWQLLAQN